MDWLEECAENARVLTRVANDSPRVSFEEAKVLTSLAERYQEIVNRNK